MQRLALLAVVLSFAQCCTAQLLPRTEWTITADSAETSSSSAPATSAIDGNVGTLWHSQYTPTVDPLPHSLTIDLGATYTVTSLLYTPRKSKNSNGNIGQYEIYVRSSDGSFDDVPVATGAFADTKATKTVPLNVSSVSGVRFVALTEAGNRGDISSAAEVELTGCTGSCSLPPPPPPPTPSPSSLPGLLPRSGWSIVADSEETVKGQAQATKAIDGDAGTIWHTQYYPSAPAHPHSLTVTLDATYSLTELLYTPRQDGRSNNGNIGQYEIYLRSAGGSFAQMPNVTGTFADTKSTKYVTLAAPNVDAVRIVALTEAGSRGPWSSAAELQLKGCIGLCSAPPPPTGSTDARLPRDTWYALADSYEQRYRAGTLAGNALDGTSSTVWHTSFKQDAHPHDIIIVMGGGINKVSGLEYLPRQDNSLNGNIGLFEVYLSTDGSTFGSSPVASGAWEDTAALKEVSWPATDAMAVKLTALTEAGGRGIWTSAAEVYINGMPVSSPPYEQQGKWSPLIEFPLVPVAAASLPDGKVVTWSAYSNIFYGPLGQGYTSTSTLDTNSGTVTSTTVTNTQHDMFCPGITTLGSMQIVVTGGSNAEKTSIYHPDTGNWHPGPNMNIARGYHSSCLLSTGEIFVIGGSFSGGVFNKKPEVYTPDGSWRTLANIDSSVINTNDREGLYRADNHAWLFGWSNGQVFHAGPSKQMNWFGTSGSGTQSAAGLRPGSDAMNGNSVMFDAGKILTIGGAPSYDEVPATNDVVLISLSGSTVNTAPKASMHYRRAFCSSVVMPDGKVVVFGGQHDPVIFTDDDAALVPEMWDPTSDTWSKMAPMGAQRTYHSVAVLLPDANVFTGGGGLCKQCPVNHFDGQIWTPPALLDAAGSLKMQPTVSVTPSIAANGAQITVKANKELSIISIIRHGSSTHAVDTDQRRIELCRGIACGSGTTYTLTIPNDPGVALAGPWMVFGVATSDGAYSKAAQLQIGASQAAATSTATTTTMTSSGSSTSPTSSTETSSGSTLSSSSVTSDGGTAAPVRAYPVTPAAQPVPMPPGLSERDLI